MPCPTPEVQMPLDKIGVVCGREQESLLTDSWVVVIKVIVLGEM